MKKLIGFVCSVVIALTSIPFGILPIKADAAVFKGSGTAGDPYQISSSSDLFKLAELINDVNTNPDYRYCYYIQTADIDMENAPFTPIGTFYDTDGVTLTSDAIFAGNYDGQYHKITNLNIDYDKRYSGLFGRVGEASGVDNSNCIIGKVSVYGSVTSSSDVVGGIVGELGYGATIENCSVNATITGTKTIGGIAGDICAGGTIDGCYFNGSIVGEEKVAGITYFVNIGKNKNAEDATVKNCYAVGSIECSEKKAGIFYEFTDNGVIRNTLTIENNFYLNTMADIGSPEGIVGCTKFSEIALKACADMLGSPFVDNNEVDGFNDGYPIFEWQSTPYQFKGNGTEEDPYQISSKYELEVMRDLVNSTYFNPIYGHAYYRQTSDIDLENVSWIPIGLGYNDDNNGNIGKGEYNCWTRMFYGSYDGNQKYIKNLNVNDDWLDAGLFGFIKGEKINNYIGVLKDLVVYGNVNSPISDHAGGLVGQMQYETVISGCAFIGNVSGGKSTAANGAAGGIAGYMWASGTISNCYHNGAVTSGKYAGGITGNVRFGQYNSDGQNSLIENCYHANGVVFGESYSSVVVGHCDYYKDIDNKIYVRNCYGASDSDSSATSDNATSDNTMLLPKSLLKKVAEDLGDAYVDNTDNTLNDGYPVFSWQVDKSVNVMGDVNEDGEFNISDVVLLQKWLLVVPDIKLANWKNADFCKDDKLDVFDLCIMKRKLMK